MESANQDPPCTAYMGGEMVPIQGIWWVDGGSRNSS